MQASYSIARIAGPVMAVLGIGALINGAAYNEISRQLLGNSAMVALSGILGLATGLAILNAHPRWTADWRSLITALGWLLTVMGVFRIFAPDLVRFIGATSNPRVVTVLAIIFLVVGGILTFKAYVAEQPQSQRRELKS
ncbi:hypothetical protein [Undibacter mobilis]|uniref:hypothetical protein n=1 Tax=Undibacter mobilis TaxID=2292256 RepID=UPI0011C0698E|nr:hypothetical protein [Undibacter mobilis]